MQVQRSIKNSFLKINSSNQMGRKQDLLASKKHYFDQRLGLVIL